MRKWSISKSAMYGAGLGIPLSILSALINGRSVFSGDLFYDVGGIVGAVIGGGFLFVIIASLRNFVLGLVVKSPN